MTSDFVLMFLCPETALCLPAVSVPEGRFRVCWWQTEHVLHTVSLSQNEKAFLEWDRDLSSSSVSVAPDANTVNHHENKAWWGLLRVETLSLLFPALASADSQAFTDLQWLYTMLLGVKPCWTLLVLGPDWTAALAFQVFLLYFFRQNDNIMQRKTAREPASIMLPVQSDLTGTLVVNSWVRALRALSQEGACHASFFSSSTENKIMMDGSQWLFSQKDQILHLTG